MYFKHLVAGVLVLMAASAANAQQLVWVRAANGDLPLDAVQGGREANGDELYICRASYNGGVHPGKIRTAFGGCNIPWGGREIKVTQYEVLVERR